MKVENFNQILTEQLARCEQILSKKASEYATEDRLHNFKIAAELEDETPTQALAGMMAKHTISIYDMCMSGEEYPTELWDEKITDHINYLILLKAVITEHNESLETLRMCPDHKVEG